MTSKLFVVGAIMAFAGVSVLFGGGASEASTAPDQESTHEIIVAFDAVDTVSWARGIRKFAELAEEASNGRLTFRISSGGIMGSQRQVLENMQLGTIHMTYTFEPLTAWVPEIDAYSFLYMFDDYDHVRRVDRGEVGQQLKQLVVEKAGFRPIMSYVREARQLTSNRPIRSIEDVQRLRIRTTPSPVVIRSWEAIGARPVPMPMGEVFSALQQGVIDGQENPLSVIHARNVYEVNSHIALTNHQYSLVWVLISESKFRSLPADLQQVILAAAEEAEAYEHEIAKGEWAEMRQTLEDAGVTFTEPDVTGFRAATRDIYRGFPELAPFVEQILNAQ